MRIQCGTVRLLITVAATAVLLSLGACNSASDQPQSGKSSKPKAAEKPTEPTFATGRAAFQRMYVSARTWSIDSQPISLTSDPATPSAHPGQSAAWFAVFASPRMQNTRVYSWSGMTGPHAPDPGVSPGQVDYYTPSNASTRIFDLNFLKVDSDKAFEVAQKNGGEAVLKKNPNLQVKYTLFWDAQHGRLLWRVTYGESDVKSKLKALVNASGAEFVMIEK